jgi:hypothetical protein
MTNLRFSLRATLRRLLVPFVAANAVAWLCLGSQPPLQGAGDDAAAVGRLWLHAPAFLLTIAAFAAALELWPLLSRERPGADLLRRLQPGPCDGCAAFAAGAWLALALALAATGAGFALMMRAHGFPTGHARAHVAPLPLQRVPVLGGNQTVLQFDVPELGPVVGLRLNPRLALRDVEDYRPVDVRVSADGAPLHDGTLRFSGSNEHRDLTFPPRTLRRIELAAEPGSGLLLSFLERGSIETVGARAFGAIANAVLAALSYLAPAALLFACACAARRHLALPVSLAVGLALLIIGTLLELTPNTRALSAWAADRWLGTENLLAASGPCAAMIAGALGVAFLIGRRVN